MYATFGNAQTGEVGPTLGPFPFAQITYGTLRAGEAEGDAIDIAWYVDRTGLWKIVTPVRRVRVTEPLGVDTDPTWWASVTGTTWTDVTLHVDPKDALA